MAGTMRKMMEYLSLAEPAEGYYDEDEAYETDDVARTREQPVEEHRAEVTPISRVAALHTEVPVVTEDLRRIVTVHPSSYNEARIIGEAFRDGTPVIMNLTGMSEPDAKRMVDFSAGLVFGLRGAMERVTNRVFLLSPATVEIDSEHTDDGRVPGRLFRQG